MRVLIIGANLCNRGAEAMLLTVVKALLSRFPHADVRAASYAKEDRSRAGMIHFDDPGGSQFSYTLIENRKRAITIAAQLLVVLIPAWLLPSLLVNRMAFIREINAADMVIDLSGFALSDDRPLWRVAIYWLEAATSDALRTPFIAMTQAFGPFHRTLTRLLARSAIRRSNLAIARGNASAKHLESLGFLRGKDFRISVDITYALEPAPLSIANEIIGDTDSPIIGIVPNTNIYKRSTGKALENSYVQLLSELCNHSAHTLNASPILICHEHYEDRFDDFDLARLVQNKTNDMCKPRIIPARYPATVMKALIGRCDLVVSSRFHAMIAALSSATPVLVVSWAHKYAESMCSAGIESYIIDAAHTSTSEAKSLLDHCWRARAELRLRMEEPAGIGRGEAAQTIKTMLSTLTSDTDPGHIRSGSANQ